MTLRSRFTGTLQGTGGLGFSPGHWRADKPGASALPSGPQGPIERLDPEPDGRLGLSHRDPRTAANMAAHAAALTPRRYRPPEDET